MIINLLIAIVLALFGAIFQLLPIVTIADLPFIGEAVSGTLITIVQTWNAAQETLPYLTYSWHVFLAVILPFEFLMLLGKFFLGHRMPTNS